jgi:hypothetical protein
MALITGTGDHCRVDEESSLHVILLHQWKRDPELIDGTIVVCQGDSRLFAGLTGFN